MLGSLIPCNVCFRGHSKNKKRRGRKETKGVPIGSNQAHLEINFDTSRTSGVRAHKSIADEARTSACRHAWRSTKSIHHAIFWEQ